MGDTDNYVKTCEAVHALCHWSLPSIQACIEHWHQNKKQTLKPCLTSTCPVGKKPSSKNQACQSCIDWGTAVEAECYPPGQNVQWKNINASLLHKDPLEVAKGFAFIIPQGQAFTSFDDFDVGGILKIMMGCKQYHHGDQACVDKIEEVLKIRNGLSHMKVKENMGISDTQLKKFVDDINDVATYLETIHPALQADDVKKTLSEIIQREVTVAMVTRALSPLTDGLKAVLEEANRHQTDFLKHFIEQKTEEIQQSISSATAQLKPEIQNLTQKVEEIPVAVQRSIEPDILGLQREVADVREGLGRLAAQPSSEHHFDIQAVREQLMAEYKQTRGKLLLLPGVPEECASMDDLFVDMELWENLNKPGEVSPRKLQSYDELVNLKDCKEQSVNRILVKGNPGCGKSTLISKLAYDWAKNDPSSPYHKFQLLFVIDLKEATPGTDLLDVVKDQLLPKISKEALEKYIECHAESVMWLFDGYDEAPLSFQEGNCGDIKHILSSKWLSQSCLIMTTRLYKVSDINVRYKSYVQVELTGLSVESMVHYAAKFFDVPFEHLAWVCMMKKHLFILNPADPSAEKPPTNRMEEVKNVASFLAKITSTEALRQICKFPIMLTMMCFLWKEEQDLTHVSTRLYLEALVHMAKHRLGKNSEGEEMDVSGIRKVVDGLLVKLGKIALDGLLENKLLFPGKDFDLEILNKACEVGLVSKERKRSKLNPVSFVCFLHKTFQEMSAAYYWASLANNDPELFESYLNEVDEMEDKELLLRFCCGFSESGKAIKVILPRVVHSSCILREYIQKSKEYECFFGHEQKELDPWRLPLLLLYESEHHLDLQQQLRSFLCPLVSKLEMVANCCEDMNELLVVMTYFVGEAENGASTWLASVKEVLLKDKTNNYPNNKEGHDRYMIVAAKTVSCMSMLKSLKLHGCHTHDCTPLLNNMITNPKATKLLKQFISESYIFSSQSMADFLSTQPCLTHVCLRRPINPWTKDNPQEISKIVCAVKDIPSLTKLILEECGLGQYVTCLAPLLPQLTELQLPCMHSKETSDCGTLFQMLRDSKKLELVKLNVQGNPLGEDIQIAVDAIKRMPKLQVLSMRYIFKDSNSDMLQEKQFQILGPALKYLKNLVELNLVHQEIGSAMKEVGQGLQHLQKLEVLQLHGCGLTKESVSFLPFEQLPQLTILCLGGNKFSGACQALSEKLKHLQNLKDFELCAAGLTDEDVALLPISSFTSLISLDLGHNDVWSDGVCAIAKHLKHTPKLEKLVLIAKNTGVDDKITIAKHQVRGTEAIIRTLPSLPRLNSLWLPDFSGIPYDVCETSALLTECVVKVGHISFESKHKGIPHSLVFPGSFSHEKEIERLTAVIQQHVDKSNDIA